MSQILQKLYFFVKLSSSILLLLIVLVLIFVFSKSYFDQEAFIYEDSQKNIDDVLQKLCKNPEINDIKPSNFELIIYKVINNTFTN